MPNKPHTPLSMFWLLFVPGVVLGIGYLVWQSNGLLGQMIRRVFGPLVRFVDGLLGSLF